MKKILFAIIILALSHLMQAQSYDTIIGRSPNYYYPFWYDTCSAMHTPRWLRAVCLSDFQPYNNEEYLVRNDTITDTVWIKGLACLVKKNPYIKCNRRDYYYRTNETFPEYMYLGKFSYSDTSFSPDDSIRWDTAQPKIMLLPKNHDPSYGYEECWAYEAFFDQPKRITGHFAIAGSNHNNHPNPPTFDRKPNNYVGIEIDNACLDRNWRRTHSWYSWTADMAGSYHENYGWLTSPFFLILEHTWVLNTYTNDSTMGIATGGGRRNDSSYVQITAIPERQYKFLHWNDGNTSNPRTIYLLRDTTFTAYFGPKEVYRVVTRSSHPWCHTYGSGLYYQDEVVTLTARPSSHMQFVRWSDGNTDNPRYLTVEKDTLVTAEFKVRRTQGIDPITQPQFSVTPNPAHDIITLTVGPELLHATVLLLDESGAELARIPIDSPTLSINIQAYPKGIYFLSINSDHGTTTQKVVFD